MIYFLSGLRTNNFSLPANQSHRPVLIDSHCVKPCQRTIYEPATSNAALSALSMESILSLNKEKVQQQRHLSRGISHRLQVQSFSTTVEKLTAVSNAFE